MRAGIEAATSIDGVRQIHTANYGGKLARARSTCTACSSSPLRRPHAESRRPSCLRSGARQTSHGFVDLHGGEGRRYGSLGLALAGPLTRLRLRRDSAVAAEGRTRRARCATPLRWWSVSTFRPGSGSTSRGHPPHAGLGSGTQLALAVGAGMAKLFDLDVGTAEIAAALDRGTRSGLGIGLFDQGGFVVDGGSAGDGVPPPVIARQPFPSEWRLLLVFDHDARGRSGRRKSRSSPRFSSSPRPTRRSSAVWC